MVPSNPGYNVGSVYYYKGSQMYIEWTNQHSCGQGNNANCELIMQYMCDPLLRDGTTTNRIPDQPTNCYGNNCDTDVRFGRQESYMYYQNCKWRSRNKGLFWGSQNPGGTSAQFTRQNNVGDRHGYECPEERDYYPYWGPTPWVDAVILTNDDSRCAAYQAESQNVKARSFCNIPLPYITQLQKNNNWNARGFIPIDKATCEQLHTQNMWKAVGLNVSGLAAWAAQPAWGVAPPVCQLTPQTRDNHLGNIHTGYPASFNWTVPKTFPTSEQCVFRLRYNISTGEFANVSSGVANSGWAGAASIQEGIDKTMNQSPQGGQDNKNPARLDVWSRFGLSYADVAGSFPASNTGTNPSNLAASRDYVLKNNPQVDILGQMTASSGSFPSGRTGRLRLQLAVNTAQFGRTFQDRSHRFAVRDYPGALSAGGIINLQVRGKRGNIVQVYPAVEYDFAPTRLTVSPGTLVHFQWTGSNTNPDNNAGQGKAGTDRSNVIVMHGPNFVEVGAITANTYGHWSNDYPGFANVSFLGLAPADIAFLATGLASGVSNGVQMGGSMAQMDDASTYFDLGPRAVSGSGTWYYMCTRNNDFSNRAQRAVITIDPAFQAIATQSFSVAGGRMSLGQAAPLVSVAMPPGAVNRLVNVQVESILSTSPSSLDATGSAPNSNFVVVSPGLSLAAPMAVSFPYSTTLVDKLYTQHVYAASATLNDPFSPVLPAQVQMDSTTGVATVTTTTGGVFVVRNDLDTAAVAGLIVGGAVLLVGGVLLGIYCVKKRAAMAALAQVAQTAQTSSAGSKASAAAEDAIASIPLVQRA